MLSAGQWRHRGISKALVRSLTRSGDLVSLRRGVYATRSAVRWADADPVRLHVLQLLAAQATVGRHAVASFHSAAILHRIDLLARPPEATVALTLPPDKPWNRTRPSSVVFHSAHVPKEQRTTLYGIPLTTPARTVADLARTLPFTDAVVAADCALHQEKLTRKELGQILDDCPRWPGIRQARRVLEFADERAESPLESAARVVFDQFGLEPPELQAAIRLPQAAFRVDFFWPGENKENGAGLVAEADGLLKYNDRADLIRQLERDRQLGDAGYTVVHFTWEELFGTPETVVSRIRRARVPLNALYLSVAISSRRVDGVIPRRLSRLKSPLGVKFARFAGAAAAALTATEVALTISNAVLHLTATPAALVSWFAGAVVSYGLSRWAWNRTGRPSVLRETIPFWGISVAVIVLLTLANKLGYRSAAWLHLTGVHHVLWVDFVWLLANLGTFLLRFAIFHFVLFSDRTTASSGRTNEGVPSPPAPAEAEAEAASRRLRLTTAPLAPPGAQHDAGEPAAVEQVVHRRAVQRRQQVLSLLALPDLPPVNGGGQLEHPVAVRDDADEQFRRLVLRLFQPDGAGHFRPHGPQAKGGVADLLPGERANQQREEAHAGPPDRVPGLLAAHPA